MLSTTNQFSSDSATPLSHSVEGRYECTLKQLTVQCTLLFALKAFEQWIQKKP